MNMEMRIKIRKAYEKAMPLIQKGEVGPYDIGIDWINKFSPIEDNVWGSIRYLGLPLYPQFPIGNYFVDFADPIRRIVIEVDSVMWHKDKEADDKRQTEIENLGWEVHRIPSRMTYKIKDDFMDSDEHLTEEAWGKYMAETAEGYLRNLYADRRGKIHEVNIGGRV